MDAVRAVRPRKPWLAASSWSYASTSTIRPPTPSTSSVAPISSGATSCTERAKNSRVSRRPATCGLEKLFRLGRRSGLLEHALRAPAEVAHVERPLVHRLRDALREIERVVENGHRRRRVLPHVVEDRALGASSEDRLRDPVDPD